MNYAVRVRHAIDSTTEQKTLEDSSKITLTADVKIEDELTKEYIMPTRLDSKTYFGDTKDTETKSEFYVLQEFVEKDKDNLEKLLFMLEEKLATLDWYEIQVSVNHEDEGVTVSNSPWQVVRTYGTVPKETLTK